MTDDDSKTMGPTLQTCPYGHEFFIDKPPDTDATAPCAVPGCADGVKGEFFRKQTAALVEPAKVWLFQRRETLRVVDGKQVLSWMWAWATPEDAARIGAPPEAMAQIATPALVAEVRSLHAKLQEIGRIVRVAIQNDSDASASLAIDIINKVLGH